MTKPNKDGWIRHRGGKCPVEKGTLVDVRHRDGEIVIGVPAKEWIFGKPNASEWRHNNDEGDIMAWRPHKPAYTDFQPAPMIEASKKPEALVLDYSPSLHIQSFGRVYRHEGDPRKMRDRIREIDAASIALNEERASLVSKLKAEGFALIQGDEPNSEVESVQQDIAQQDMSDPANWRVGDIIEVLCPEHSGFSVGDKAQIIEMDEGSDDMPCKLKGSSVWLWLENMKWHSRPTN